VDRQQLDLRAAGDQPLARVENLDDVGRVGGDDGYPDLRSARQIEGAHLGGGHLELAQGGHDRPHVGPLGLQGSGVAGQQQVEDSGSGVHDRRF